MKNVYPTFSEFKMSCFVRQAIQYLKKKVVYNHVKQRKAAISHVQRGGTGEILSFFCQFCQSSTRNITVCCLQKLYISKGMFHQSHLTLTQFSFLFFFIIIWVNFTFLWFSFWRMEKKCPEVHVQIHVCRITELDSLMHTHKKYNTKLLNKKYIK